MMASTTQTCAVIGVGNVLMADEGVGVHVVRELQRSSATDAALFDAGTALSDVLFEVDGFRKIVIVDSLRAGDEPGSVYRVDLDNLLPLADSASALSLHEYDVAPALRDALLAGVALGEVVLIGVEPALVERRLGLSPQLSERIPVIVQSVLDEIATSQTQHP